MTSRTLFFFVAFSSTLSSFAQEQYLGQAPPSLKPEVFAPALISTADEYEFGSVFSKDGKEFYYGVTINGRSEIRFTEYKNGIWTKAKTILSHSEYGMNDPFLSPDQSELYFISKKDTESSGAKNDHDIWYVKREGNGWSKPINAGPNINTRRNEYYISFTNEGTMYFSSDINDSNHDIYSSERINGVYQKPVRLGEAINTPNYEADVFVAPDESYLIYAANRGEGKRGELYISFKQEDGSWSPSKNMGPDINTDGHELCPFVTYDGKYFFYTSKQDIYWVDAKILDRYK